MRFKIDENLPVEVVEMLRATGHDALTLLDQNVVGHPDGRIADIVRDEKRALITLDLVFANIRAFPPNNYAGLIVLRLARQEKKHIEGHDSRHCFAEHRAVGRNALGGG